MKDLIGRADILFITLDTLRYDAAQHAWLTGQLDTLAPYLGRRGWEKRHTPASFTYAAHHAFFAGFLPTPLGQGPHPRLFASQFAGSVSTIENTFCFEEATLPQALAARNYRTICVGGTGFFNQQNQLARVLPSFFTEAHWSPDLGVACRNSAKNQIERAIQAVDAARQERVFLFINISAIHQPNWFYGDGQGPDTLASHTAALVAVDRALQPLFQRLKKRAPTLALVCSDHGTAYGEDGYLGHRLGHEVVWNVPYAEFML
ncbi:MAG: metalloenzyme protein [Chthoniobacteraceae bacterium]|nr:metalloenzyme protein [Chthoniobacteraceae bacterium]